MVIFAIFLSIMLGVALGFCITMCLLKKSNDMGDSKNTFENISKTGFMLSEKADNISPKAYQAKLNLKN